MAKRPGVPFSKGRKVCIFCGGTPTTAEHIWPQWARDILPRGARHRQIIIGGRVSVGLQLRRNYRRQGPIHNLRIPRACATCNSGWMSKAEVEIRPTLERMMQGGRVILDRESQAALALYLTYKLMVVDWMDAEPVMPPDWAHNAYLRREIPNRFKLWIYNCSDGPWRAALHCAVIGLFKDGEKEPPLRRNVKSFAIGIGGLFVLALASTEFDLDLELNRRAGVRLWPPEHDRLIWPPLAAINSSEADYISRVIHRLRDELSG